MKRFFYPLLFFFGFCMVLAACTKKPSASFVADKLEVETYEPIQFTNTSMDAYSYEWDFGDGEKSVEKSPSHAYETAGTRGIQLIAYSKKKKQIATFSLSINVKANGFGFDGAIDGNGFSSHSDASSSTGYADGGPGSYYWSSPSFKLTLGPSDPEKFRDMGVGTNFAFNAEARVEATTGVDMSSSWMGQSYGNTFRVTEVTRLYKKSGEKITRFKGFLNCNAKNLFFNGTSLPSVVIAGEFYGYFLD
jgi:PKD repeat protein